VERADALPDESGPRPGSRESAPAVRWARRAWTSDLGLSGLALVAFVVAFVLEPLAAHVPWMAWLLLGSEVLYGAVLVTAIIAVTGRVWAGALASGFIVIALFVRLASRIEPRLVTVDRLLAIVPMLVMMLIVTGLSLRAGPVNYHRIAGAVLSYVLIGALWARLYALVVHLVPGAIAAGSGAAVLTSDDFMYFSVMTLTTAGYGDLVPVHPLARTLASLEAIAGVLFPVVYISRFVSAVQARHPS